MRNKLIFIIGLILLSSCALQPLKGGRSTIGTTTQELVQPENPEAPSSQQVDYDVERTLVVPANSLLEFHDGTNSFSVRPSKEMPIVLKERRHRSAILGGAQKDTSRSLAASLKAMQPVMWVGILVILGGVALAYYGWWTKAAIAWAVGVGMIVIAAVVPGHSAMILGIGMPTLAFACLLVLYVYYKSHHDAKVE